MAKSSTKKATKKSAPKKAAPKKAAAKKAAPKKAAPKKVAPKKAAPKKAAKPAKKAARKLPAGFIAPLTPSATLAEVVGSKAIPRTEITKKIWEYIKKNGLQDKVKRTMINADAKLKPLFDGKGQVSMFEMTKFISKHVTK